MIIENTDFKSLDELTPELEKEIGEYCGTVKVLLDGCANCPFFPIARKYKEPCFYPTYKKNKQSAS